MNDRLTTRHVEVIPVTPDYDIEGELFLEAMRESSIEVHSDRAAWQDGNEGTSYGEEGLMDYMTAASRELERQQHAGPRHRITADEGIPPAHLWDQHQGDYALRVPMWRAAQTMHVSITAEPAWGNLGRSPAGAHVATNVPVAPHDLRIRRMFV